MYEISTFGYCLAFTAPTVDRVRTALVGQLREAGVEARLARRAALRRANGLETIPVVVIVHVGAQVEARRAIVAAVVVVAIGGRVAAAGGRLRRGFDTRRAARREQ